MPGARPLPRAIGRAMPSTASAMRLTWFRRVLPQDARHVAPRPNVPRQLAASRDAPLCRGIVAFSNGSRRSISRLVTVRHEEVAMPLGRISLRKGKPAEYRRAIADQIYEALKESFD